MFFQLNHLLKSTYFLSQIKPKFYKCPSKVTPLNLHREYLDRQMDIFYKERINNQISLNQDEERERLQTYQPYQVTNLRKDMKFLDRRYNITFRFKTE